MSTRMASLPNMRKVVIFLFIAFACTLFMWTADFSYPISIGNIPVSWLNISRPGSLLNFKFGGSKDSLTTDSNLLETLNILSNDTVSDSESDKSCHPFAGALWSRESDSVNWTDSMEMCKSILRSNSSEDIDLIVAEAKNWTIPQVHTDESIAELLSDCNRFLSKVPFPTRPSSKEEATFPLAYVLVGARNAAQTVRFFRNIYQPQNAYCITYDNKSGEAYKEAIQKLVGCFPAKNVYLTPSPEDIHYAHYSILHSVMVCLEVLIKQWTRTKWRYVQITSWNDFPLKTNREMVRIFQILNGSQDSNLDPLMPHFFTFNHGYEMYQFEHIPRKTVPHGLSMYKGSLATSMTNEFVRFLFTNQISQDLYKWMNGSWCPEEHYLATIIHNNHLNAPGSFPGQCLHFYAELHFHKPWASRYQVWFSDPPETCKGQIVNLSCVFGVADIEILIERPELMAHKVYEEFEPATVFCLDYWYRYSRCSSPMAIDESYYQDFPSVRYMATGNKDDFVC